MESKNSYVAGAGPARALGGAWQQNPPVSDQELKVSIKKFGRGMNSNKPERRYLYLYIAPFDSDELETGVRKITEVLNKLLVVWEPPVRRKFLRQDMWWEHVPCQHCLRRIEYETRKWQANEYVWRRNMCLRHWFVHHLSMTAPSEPKDLISNRQISIEVDDRLVQFNISTANYEYWVWADKERAEMEVAYKGKTYKFTFRNHLRGYPYLSSYMNIMIDVYNALEVFRDFLVDYVLKRRVYANVVINDVFTIPPARDNAGECDVCQL